ncbi:hypothetical protein OUZ56_022841 [Daphnia magna]|uniref:Uncharacterized protein n=1 Tax=Daphnia magna TaxID=35525 RepID=A0ABR0AXM3_9CRUS|nr:hypothetical protein OUZ56_022841 [Daphnia magna]
MEAGQKSGGGELVCNSTDSRLDWPTVRFSLSFIYTPLALASSSGSITSLSEALADDGSVLISDDTRPPLSLHGNAVESRRSFSWNQRNENRAIGQPMGNGRPARQRDSVRSTDDDGKEEMKMHSKR